jgi:hypothetical protein
VVFVKVRMLLIFVASQMTGKTTAAENCFERIIEVFVTISAIFFCNIMVWL